MRDFVSKTARDLKPSGIRKFFDLCAGSPDIISLGVGEPDFVTPWQISSGGITAIKQGRTTYTGNAGLPELKKHHVTACSIITGSFPSFDSSKIRTAFTMDM